MPQGNGDQGQAQASLSAHMRNVWLVVIAVVVIGAALVSGVELARSNSDIICSRTFEDSGSCTDGSWGAWTLASQSADQNACNVTYNETRIYSGFRNTITSTITVRANAHTHCALSDDAFRGGSGEIVSQYSTCQIQESRTRVVAGSGSGPSCTLPTGYNPNAGVVTSDTNTETTGAVDESKTETVSGTYQLYLDMIDARFATSSIRAVPALLNSGETTRIIWTSDHVKTCTVAGSNGDSWPKPVEGTKIVVDADGNETTEPTSEMPAGKTGDEVSKPIVQPTTYTLTCMTALNKAQERSVMVNLIPIFQEQ